jgi:glycosyltransferase involved in cell wall biosynthesis
MVAEIPLVVAAHNEEQSIEACLRSLLRAAEVAEAALPVRLLPLVVADRCSDRTEEIAAALGVPVRRVAGGKVAAQRAGVRPAPFLIFSDADVTVDPPTLRGLCRLLLERPEVQVAYPPRAPLPPRLSSLVAACSYSYTKHEGFQRRRTWFDGKLFAIRRFDVPTTEALQPRVHGLDPDRFYALHQGIIADDVYLSRKLVHEHGLGALACGGEGCVRFRTPGTLRGMYAYYRRIRRELERTDLLFPEMAETGRRFGTRETDWEKFRAASPKDRAFFALFQGIDAALGLVYAADRAYYQTLARVDGPSWTRIPETKGLDGGLPGP